MDFAALGLAVAGFGVLFAVVGLVLALGKGLHWLAARLEKHPHGY